MLSWAPDGEWLAFAEKASEDAPARIVRLSLATLEKRPLTSPPPDSLGDLEPQISPDGRLLAFVRSGARELWQPGRVGPARERWRGPAADLRPVPVVPRPSVGHRTEPRSSSRTAPGHRREDGPRAAGGRSAPAGGGCGRECGPRVRPRELGWCTSRARDRSLDTWRLPRPGASRSTETPEKFLVSGVNAAYSPDGRKIAFESGRGGVDDIWLSNADGSHPVQLTTLKSDSGTPRWSPDGRRLVFDSLEAGNWDLYVVGADGGTPRRLTQEPSEDGTGTWSRDGRSIYFHSDRTGRSEIWKIPADGGTAVQVTRSGGFYAVESEDGRDLYYSKASASGIWRVPLSGGDESEVVKGPVGWEDWALARRGLYYATVAVSGAVVAGRSSRSSTWTSAPAVRRRSFGRKASPVIGPWPSPPMRSGFSSARPRAGSPS